MENKIRIIKFANGNTMIIKPEKCICGEDIKSEKSWYDSATFLPNGTFLEVICIHGKKFTGEET
jgi:hypothetical protein